MGLGDTAAVRDSYELLRRIKDEVMELVLMRLKVLWILKGNCRKLMQMKDELVEWMGIKLKDKMKQVL